MSESTRSQNLELVEQIKVQIQEYKETLKEGQFLTIEFPNEDAIAYEKLSLIGDSLFCFEGVTRSTVPTNFPRKEKVIQHITQLNFKITVSACSKRSTYTKEPVQH